MYWSKAPSKPDLLKTTKKSRSLSLRNLSGNYRTENIELLNLIIFTGLLKLTCFKI
jgi:hypothetical protein